MTTKELLALALAATPGPWQPMNDRDWDVVIGDIDGPDDGAMHYAAVAEIIDGSPRSRANAALIVAAVNALPALCAEVEALRKDAERWRAYERELPDSADSTRVFLHGVAVLKAAKLAAKEPTK